MSLTQQYIEELMSGVKSYLHTFKTARPIPVHIAKDIRDVLSIIESAANIKESPLPNALKLKVDLEERMENMSPTWLARIPLFDFCDLRNRLRTIIENPKFNTRYLLIDNIAELAKLANKDTTGHHSLNLQLTGQISALQKLVEELKSENSQLKSENHTLKIAVETLQKVNCSLENDKKQLTDKNHSLYQVHINSLQRIRSLECENELLRSTDSKQQQPSATVLKFR